MPPVPSSRTSWYRSASAAPSRSAVELGASRDIVRRLVGPKVRRGRGEQLYPEDMSSRRSRHRNGRRCGASSSCKQKRAVVLVITLTKKRTKRGHRGQSMDRSAAAETSRPALPLPERQQRVVVVRFFMHE